MGPARLWPIAPLPPIVFEFDKGVGDCAIAAAIYAGESRLLFFGLNGYCKYVDVSDPALPTKNDWPSCAAVAELELMLVSVDGATCCCCLLNE